jgi:hypothetical protein
MYNPAVASESGFPDALAEARETLERLLRERQQLDVRIAKMEQVVAALRSVAEHDDEEVASTGFTDGVRAVLRGSSERGLSPTEIREGMLALGFDLSRYAQPLATIHVVLKRLERSGEAIEIGGLENKRYWWTLNGEPPNPSRRQDVPSAEQRRSVSTRMKRGRPR